MAQRQLFQGKMVEWPLGYFLRKLHAVETRYPAYDRELLAISANLDHWACYVHGCKRTTIYTCWNIGIDRDEDSELIDWYIVEGRTFSLYTMGLGDSPAGKGRKTVPRAGARGLGEVSSLDMSPPVHHLRTPSPVRHLLTPIILTTRTTRHCSIYWDAIN